MREADFDQFAALLDDVAELRQLPFLSATAKALHFRALARYPVGLIQRAIEAHLIDPEAGKFKTHIQPAHIVAQIEGAAANDGRPEVDEAWAIALRAQDEAATFVWTDEISGALAAAQPVLNAGDQVGARMAFKAAYARIVEEARQERRVVRWIPSLGHDPELRDRGLQAAVGCGLLPASHVEALLPAPKGLEVAQDAAAREALDSLRRMLASAMDAGAKRRRAVEMQRDRQAGNESRRLAVLKASSAVKAQAYLEGEGESRVQDQPSMASK